MASQYEEPAAAAASSSEAVEPDAGVFSVAGVDGVVMDEDATATAPRGHCCCLPDMEGEEKPLESESLSQY